MDKKDGGPAFPNAVDFTLEGGARQFERGMSLRDYFAIEALKGIGDWTPWPQGVSSLQQGDPRIDLRTVEAQRARAAWAYSQADAMLAEREDG